MPTPLPTPLPPTSSQPVTAPETEFRADEGPLGALQTSIRNVAYTLWELSLCAQDVHPPRPEDGPHGRVARKIDEFVLQLAELDGLKDTLRMNIPLEVLQNVDATRNPHLVTKERIERAAGENQFVSGKLDALQSYHELLSASLKENFPELAPLMSGDPLYPVSMEERLASYRALDSASSRSSVNAVLTAVVSASPVSWTSGVRRDFVQILLDDVDAAGSKARLSLKELPLALLAIKTIGRQPEASAIIVVESNLLILFKIASSLGKHPNEVVNEALKCTANALLLQENGRDNWIALGGGDLCLSILQKELTAEQVFLVSRILFLITLRQSPFMRKAIEELQLVDSISAKLDFSLSVLLAEQPYGKEAMVDLLKVTFNLITQYPRIVASSLPSAGGTGSGLSESAQLGELWNDKLEGFVDPLLRLLHSIPSMSPSPLQPPLTHVFHALINVPVSGIYITKWFAASYSLPSSPIASPRVSPVDTIHRAFSRFSIGGNSSSRRSMSSNRSASRPATPFASETQGASQGFVDTIQKLFDLFSDTLTYYVSYDPDDVAVRDKCRQEGVVLDELVVPLPIILSRLAKGDETARSRLREFMLPVDLDRTTPLEKRHDILGICIRIMTCVHHPHLKETVGDFIFSICDSDPSTLATQIGYGNAAGFLFSKGIMAPPTEAFDSSGVRLNPITGTTAALQPSTDDMTQEEKEAEAERLFVLFDRLERSGMGVNPIRRAQQEGRFENI